ncbi:GNAT family N-acetyltransferase [Modestobacter sp. I12A-02628]|uniref:GNAT family N-acetyltransferase n=1 Tax=Goekera deserti TaxID=2497753 RepID=A0A7K3WIX3_9ACTN|nr:GNAT family N-acetyltransferase [Goekera deserti]MPQ96672.1 GNAT family N-acetyltransferase [Goekera deserti]NDI47016.1 GNAT family N-acetyltransferase [Goekera deserti]NEL56252.1 GNAT family N-acetyltransferase [Goekera deserti]
MTIRAYREADHAAVAELWRQSGIEVVPAGELHATLRHAPDLMVVDVDGDDAVGGVLLGTFDGRRGWLHRLAVAPGRRRTGLATRLVREVERRLTARGAPRVNLMVLPDNTSGLAFWAALGYLPAPDVLCSKALHSGGPA